VNVAVCLNLVKEGKLGSIFLPPVGKQVCTFRCDIAVCGMKIILIGLGIGVFAGIMAGLCGVGGGIVMVPAFVYLLGLDQKQAIATSMAVIVPTAIMAIGRFSAAGLVQWNIFWPTAVGAILAAFLATGWVKQLSNLTLTRIFAIMMIVIGISMILKKN